MFTTIDPSRAAPPGDDRDRSGLGRMLGRLRRTGPLILAGDDDPIIPLVNGRIMRWLIPRSQLHVYHGGHLELAADSGRLAAVVQAFLGPGGADDDTGR